MYYQCTIWDDDYDYRPRFEHVIAEWAGESAWQDFYRELGQGEYVNNVLAFVSELNKCSPHTNDGTIQSMLWYLMPTTNPEQKLDLSFWYSPIAAATV